MRIPNSTSIWYRRFMQKPFVTQAELFVSSSDLEHPALHALDDTEAVLDWSKIEPILSSVYASQTGRPSYPLLTLFRGLLLGVWYRLSDVQLSQCLYRDLLFRKFCHLELGGDVNFVAVPGHWGTFPLSMKGALNGTTSKNIYRRV